jgi:hypothetical protein
MAWRWKVLQVSSALDNFEEEEHWSGSLLN